MQNFDFVVGIHVLLSNNHTLNGQPFYDICDELSGKNEYDKRGRYPKTFKFTGWHPLCRCFAVPILKTEEEMEEDNERILNGEEPKEKSKNTVKDIPKEMKEWIKDNKSRMMRAKSLPYFIKDNPRYFGLHKAKEIADIRHKARAPEQIADIQQRWDERRKLNLLNVAAARHASRTVENIESIKEQWHKRSKLYNVMESCNARGIDYLDVQKLGNILDNDKLISKIGGGDMTGGSCSSVALAYIGNKKGYDVLDFRGGKSRIYFSENTVIDEITRSIGGKIIKHTNDFAAAKLILSTIVRGKEYYFGCGKHVAIIRKTNKTIEYLELQSSTSNGWKELNERVLKNRFGAQKSHTFRGRKIGNSCELIDIDLFKGNSGLRRLLGYINTESGRQQKGIKGRIR